jgi:hypothetical protein
MNQELDSSLFVIKDFEIILSFFHPMRWYRIDPTIFKMGIGIRMC